jgi:hypothetical protein
MVARYSYVWADLNLSAFIGINWVCRGLFLHVLCRGDMPFLEKLANIAVLWRHVGDMLATFPAKIKGCPCTASFNVGQNDA